MDGRNLRTEELPDKEFSKQRKQQHKQFVKQRDELKALYIKAYQLKDFFKGHIDWLQERFPSGVYEDVIGLCKAASIKDAYSAPK